MVIRKLQNRLTLLLFCFVVLNGTAQSEHDSLNTLRYFNAFLKYEYEDTLKARIYADSGVYYAKKSKSNWLLGDAYRMLGWYYHDQSRYQQAADQYYKSLSYLKKAGDKQGIADAYGNLGNAYLDMGNLMKSLDYQLLSLQTNEEILGSDTKEKSRERAAEGKAIALHNIGAIYSDIKMYDKALEYAFAGLKHDVATGDEVGKAISYNTIATMHKEMGQADSAEYYYKMALDIYKKNPHPHGEASSLLSYATLNPSQLTESEKKQMIWEALQIRKKLSDGFGEASTLIEICKVYFDELSVDSLSAMLKRSYDLIEEDNLEGLKQEYFLIYSKYNSLLGKYDSAYFALENYLELKAVSDERRHANDLIAESVKHQLRNRYYNDSLQQVNEFATERAQYHKELSEVQNIVYLSVIGFIILIAFLFFFISSNRRKNRMNQILTEKNALIQDQKSVVEEKNKSISDSINYARRLQSAILPTPEQINEYLPDSFLFFRPKDVVSGDFYWFERSQNISFLAVADCTGHGVPGAMVSVVGSNALNRSVNEFGLLDPKNILDKTREIVIETFAKSGENVADGMDISLIAVDAKNKKIVFSGAHNSLWVIRDSDKSDTELLINNRQLSDGGKTLIEFKGDKQPIGLFEEMKEFSQIEIPLCENDIFYLFSDGYADQFGGEEGKKFKYVPFKKMLLANAHQSMEAQKSILVSTFDTWKGDHDQVDDVCVIGVRIL